ncbi:MAG: transporter substrate-binding domain-containing protein [Pararhodobacter sp.]|nr:transporter substrate-binding domain-containing protein [Pararhodobacter sp.]
MKATMLLGLAMAAIPGLSAPVLAQTMEAVRERGSLNCAIPSDMRGFASVDSAGAWSGFDVAFCRALAAAVLGSSTSVTFVPGTREERFDALISGEADVMSGNAGWRYQRDTELPVSFVGVTLYDGLGFMVSRELGVAAAQELDGMRICVDPDAPSTRALDEYFSMWDKRYVPVPVQSRTDVQEHYLGGACDAVSAEISRLAAIRAAFAAPGDHVFLPEVFAREPQSLVVRDDDIQWADIVRWTLNALVYAEELGVTSANVNELAAASNNPDIGRLLGSSGDLGAMLGLEPEWARRAIAAGGHYGEIFAANIGQQTPIGLSRGLNALWTQGGLLFSPPFR